MRTLLTSALALLLLAPVASAQTATELFPNHDGNTWSYEVAGAIGGGNTQDIKITARSGGWAQVEGFLGQTRWWWMSSQSGRMWTWDANTGTYDLAMNLGVGQGNRFTARIGNPTAGCFNGTEWEVTDENATIQTPVGTFQNCLVIANVAPVCADAGYSSFAFAPNVGIVRYTWTTFAGGMSATLNHAMVDGTEYRPQAPVAQGLSVKVEIDKATYTVTDNRMPIVPPGGRPLRPESMTVKLTIENKTAETLPFTFNSGQSFDIYVRDSAGNVLWRWSNGRFFTMAIRMIDMLPGETWDYSDTFELRDNNGDALPEGYYQLEFVQTAGPRVVSATAGFKVELQVVH